MTAEVSGEKNKKKKKKKKKERKQSKGKEGEMVLKPTCGYVTALS